jgi:hypothetical protein
MYQTVSLVEVGVYVYAYASMPPPCFHAIGSKTARRDAALRRMHLKFPTQQPTQRMQDLRLVEPGKIAPIPHPSVPLHAASLQASDREW